MNDSPTEVFSLQEAKRKGSPISIHIPTCHEAPKILFFTGGNVLYFYIKMHIDALREFIQFLQNTCIEKHLMVLSRFVFQDITWKMGVCNIVRINT